MPRKPRATPSTVAEKPTTKYEGPPAVRVRAIRHGHNDVEVIEETFSGPPTSTRSLKRCDTTSAMYLVRTRNEEWLGPNRFGDSGL